MFSSVIVIVTVIVIERTGTIQRTDGEKLTIAFDNGESRTLLRKFVTLD